MSGRGRWLRTTSYKKRPQVKETQVIFPTRMKIGIAYLHHNLLHINHGFLPRLEDIDHKDGSTMIRSPIHTLQYLPQTHAREAGASTFVRGQVGHQHVKWVVPHDPPKPPTVLHVAACQPQLCKSERSTGTTNSALANRGRTRKMRPAALRGKGYLWAQGLDLSYKWPQDRALSWGRAYGFSTVVNREDAFQKHIGNINHVMSVVPSNHHTKESTKRPTPVDMFNILLKSAIHNLHTNPTKRT